MKSTFTLLFFFTCSMAFGQSHFVKGYYVNAAGDTIQSYINDRNWDKNPDRIQVKTSSEANTVQIYTLSEIKSFALSTGDVYVKEHVQVDKSPVNIDEIAVGDKPTIVTDTVFLRLLVKGKASLFYLKDENGKEHFYIQKESETPQELILSKRKEVVSGRTVLTTVEIYKGILSSYLADCAEVGGKIKHARFEASSLQPLVSKYNACFETPADAYVAKEVNKLKYQFSVTAGTTYNQLLFKGASYQPDFSDFSYTAGAALNIVIPRGRERWSIYNEVAWKPYKMEHTQEYNYSADMYRKRTITFDMGYIGLGTMVRYRLSNIRLQPFINVGMANNFALKNENKVTYYDRYYTTESVSEKKALEPTRRHEESILVGMGISRKNITAEIRFENGTGMSFNTIKNAGSFMLSYFFL